MYFVFYAGNDYYFIGKMLPGSFRTFTRERLYFHDGFGYIDIMINFWSSESPVQTYFKASDGTIGENNTLIRVYAR